MRVVFDSQIFRFQAYGGVSRYIVELARWLARMEETSVRVLAPLHLNEYLKAAADIPQRSWYVKSVPPGIRRHIDTWACNRMIASAKADVVHATYYSPPPRPAGARLVVTVHDMIHEKFPQYFSQQDHTARLKRAALRDADRIICISENTRRDVIELLNVPPERTCVIHHGTVETREGTLPAILCGVPYLLFVGLRGGYKNFRRLLQAYAAMGAASKDLRLVAFGGGAFDEEEHALMRQLGMGENAAMQISGSDATLCALYRNALAFVYPSMYEGFGMSLLEAMVHGCPVLTSNTSSMPEVAGDAALYFDPAETDSIRHALESVIFSESRRRELQRLGQIRAAGFSWRKTAAQTRAAYAAALA